ncbi:type I-E CRISPR-associated protein Cse2/CasB [Actinomyces radicidentis]|uniref:type I-E CRISPR-associated protein Cse2/CasB n=1 Tax=Actinomyces radicidentis TaxID=111015 RepID=UPI0028E23BEB|nr:type I-E CRISPR-associated protein Cse2/CasB [Actinomyces radicidentis]
MTDTTTARPSRLGRAGTFVATRVSPLQRGYLNAESRARGQLAALRRASTQPPGTVPEAWELTQPEDVPANAGDEPTREEQAIHTAMTLYAVHQQSRSEPMHAMGVGLGHAASRLIGHGDDESAPARARFNALVTASSLAELRRHLRTFVSLLRSRGIALDYARLADDVDRFQRPGGAMVVRRQWARELYVRPATTPDQTTSTATDQES